MSRLLGHRTGPVADRLAGVLVKGEASCLARDLRVAGSEAFA